MWWNKLPELCLNFLVILILSAPLWYTITFLAIFQPFLGFLTKLENRTVPFSNNIIQILLLYRLEILYMHHQ